MECSVVHIDTTSVLTVLSDFGKILQFDEIQEIRFYKNEYNPLFMDVPSKIRMNGCDNKNGFHDYKKRIRETTMPESDQDVGLFRPTNMQIHARFEQIDVQLLRIVPSNLITQYPPAAGDSHKSHVTPRNVAAAMTVVHRCYNTLHMKESHTAHVRDNIQQNHDSH